METYTLTSHVYRMYDVRCTMALTMHSDWMSAADMGATLKSHFYTPVHFYVLMPMS